MHGAHLTEITEGQIEIPAFGDFKLKIIDKTKIKLKDEKFLTLDADKKIPITSTSEEIENIELNEKQDKFISKFLESVTKSISSLNTTIELTQEHIRKIKISLINQIFLSKKDEICPLSFSKISELNLKEAIIIFEFAEINSRPLTIYSSAEFFKYSRFLERRRNPIQNIATGQITDLEKSVAIFAMPDAEDPQKIKFLNFKIDSLKDFSYLAIARSPEAFQKAKEDGLFDLFIKSGVDVNAQDSLGRSPLLLASQMRNRELFEILLKIPGIDVNLQDYSGNSPLLLASQMRNRELFEILLKIPGIDVNLQDYSGNSPLLVASKRGDPELIEMLLNTPGVDVNLQNHDGKTALAIALQQNNLELARILLDIDDINVALIDRNILRKFSYSELTLSPGIFQRAKQDGLLDLFMRLGIDENKTALNQAIESGKFEIAKELLKLPGIDVNLQDSLGRSPLLLASQMRNRELFEILLKIPGIDVNLQDSLGRSPLLVASQILDPESIEMLLKIPGIDVNLQDSSGRSPLFVVSQMRDPEPIEMLLNTPGIDVNIKDNHGDSALTLSVKKGYLENIQILLNAHGVKLNNALHLAIKKGYLKIAEKLFKTPTIEIDFKDSEGKTALAVAVAEGNLGIVKMLLASDKIDVNSIDHSGKTALAIALQQYKLDIVKLLLSDTRVNLSLIDIKKYPHFSFHAITSDPEEFQRAKISGRLDIIKKLGADVNDASGDYYQQTSLHRAIKYEHYEIAEELLQIPEIDVNLKDINGKTALIMAIEKGNLELVKILLTNPEIDVNLIDKDQNTALHLAIIIGNNQIIKELLKVPNINVNIHGTYKETPLLIATRYKNYEIIEILLNTPKLNTDINLRGDFSQSALDKAIELEDLELVKLLLNTPGIDVNSQNKTEEKTSLQVAILAGNTEIVKELLEHKGININSQDDSEANTLMTAIIKGGKIFEMIFEDSRIDVNATDKYGESALHFAVAYELYDATEKLLSSPEIDLSLKNQNGKTALDLAIEFKNQKIIDLIENRIAKQTEKSSTSASLSPTNQAKGKSSESLLRESANRTQDNEAETSCAIEISSSPQLLTSLSHQPATPLSPRTLGKNI